ncbi:transporter substrate-binding domain-containing protein [uncultured Roseovarius sp.]|uniref:transporter substrate-binding domain-containing protein n=1 Tax=uncultured Roseovarius sp. TaxID=293344 RepID=UPI003446CE35
MSVAFGLAGPGPAWALCDVTYRVQPGDTLTSVAAAHYDDADQWTLIYYANQAVLAGQVQTLVAGRDLFIPCPEENPVPDATPLLQTGAELTLLTAGANAPFSDRDWPGGGLVTELINAALELSPAPVPYEIVWEPERAQHLAPLLGEKRYDMGFPWVKPDCATTAEDALCTGFHFSDPLMDLPVMLFQRADGDLVYDEDADLLGKRLCRPAGKFTHDLDRSGRRWLEQGQVDLSQPDTSEECFAALMAGQVDAVSLDVFEGAAKIVAMGLRGRVVPVEKPLSREALYAVISKTHWRGTTHLYRLNAGLAKLRESGRYGEILQRHLAIFWEKLN